jgi:hypothetical protein
MMVPSKRGNEIDEERQNVNAPLLKMLLRWSGVLQIYSNISKFKFSYIQQGFKLYCENSIGVIGCHWKLP